jgi:hypothetical protein
MMARGRLVVSIEILDDALAVLPRGARIVGSYECLDRRAIALAIESDAIRQGADLTAIVTENGLCRTVEVKEQP